MQITGFEILRKVQEIGAIEFYEARQISLNRLVTLKVLQPKFSSNTGEIKDFVQQARSVAHFKHPNVLEVYDIGEDNGVFYVAIEHMTGRTLREIVKADGPMPCQRAIKVAEQAAAALKSAWEKAHLAHKSISPDSISISDEGWVKISGFGQPLPKDTRTLDAYLAAGIITCNPHYMSPEQAAESDRLDARTDIYSLGATVYFIMTGKEPFDSQSGTGALKQHISGRLPHPREVSRNISPSAGLLLAQMMMKEPGNRYPDWDAAISDMKKCAHGKIVTVTPGWEALSTIAPLSSTRAMQAAAAKTAAILGGPPPAVPFWIRIPVWTVLLMWWILLFICLFRDGLKDMMGVDLLTQ